jgi:hypothetical protein
MYYLRRKDLGNQLEITLIDYEGERCVVNGLLKGELEDMVREEMVKEVHRVQEKVVKMVQYEEKKE